MKKYYFLSYEIEHGWKFLDVKLGRRKRLHLEKNASAFFRTGEGRKSTERGRPARRRIF
jgi:hypothetical protein